MGYDLSQQMLIVRALARHGRNVVKTTAFLREHMETFRTVGANTLRRLLKQKRFDKLVEQEYQIWLEAERRGVAAATEEAARRAQEGTIIQKIGRMESLFDAAMEVLQKDMEKVKDSKISFSEKMKLMQMTAAIMDRQKSRLLPVIAETKEGAFLVEAVYEVLYAKFGAARTKDAMKEIGPLYEVKRKASEKNHNRKGVAGQGEAA